MFLSFTICAIVCIAYYIVLCVYSGPIASQNYIWLIAGILCVLCAMLVKLYRQDSKRIPLWFIVAVHTIGIVGILIFATTGIIIATHANPKPMDKLDYVIVLGAKIEEDGTPSKTLKKRLDKVLEYIDDNPDTKIVLSGGQGSDEPFSEALGMAQYLKYNGVPENKLYLEIQSVNTRENIIYSKALIERIVEEKKKQRATLEKSPGPALIAEDRPIRIGIVTSDFHMFRAMCIAKRQSIAEVYGISSATDLILVPHMGVRECLAVLKDQFLGRL